MCLYFFCKTHRSRNICEIQEKTWQAKTLKLFFSKTARFWGKFMRTKVVEREISDREYALCSSLACTIREIFVKNKKNLSFKSSTSTALYSSFSISVLIRIKISRRSMHFYGSYRVTKKSIQVEL